MDTRFLFALVIATTATTALATVPAAAQAQPKPVRAGQAPSAPTGTSAVPDTPAVPVIPPIPVVPAIPPIPAIPDLVDVAAIMETVRPALEVAANAPRIAAEARAAAAAAPMLAAEAKAIVDRMAFDFGQDRGRDREAEQREREAEMRERERERESQWYSEGQNAADDYRWDRALSYFNRVVELKGSKADAALYWKAYSQNRLGQRSEALATIAELNKNYPNSGYRKQTAVLEAEVRRDIGQPGRPQDSADDEVKLLALQSLQKDVQGDIYRRAIGRIEPVLVDAQSRRREWELSGRTSGNTIVNFAGQSNWIGQIIPVRITAANPNSLRGEAG